MSRAKDMQKSRVYDKESFPQRSAKWRKIIAKPGSRYSTGNINVVACQEYVDSILASAWFQRRWGSGWCVAVIQKSGGSAYGGSRGRKLGRMTLPVFARDEAVILHELAHVLTNHDQSIAHHGPEFVGVYLELVRYAVSKEAAAHVRSKFQTKPLVRFNRSMVPTPKDPMMIRSMPMAAKPR